MTLTTIYAQSWWFGVQENSIDAYEIRFVFDEYRWDWVVDLMGWISTHYGRVDTILNLHLKY